MALDARHARLFGDIQQLLKDEVEADEELAALPEAEREARLDEYAIIWKASQILRDAWDESYMYMVGHGISEADARELQVTFIERLD